MLKALTRLPPRTRSRCCTLFTRLLIQHLIKNVSEQLLASYLDHYATGIKRVLVN